VDTYTVDTVAPATPTALATDTTQGGRVLVSWTLPVLDEEGTALTGFSQVRVYRDTNPTKSDWRVDSPDFILSAADLSWSDTSVAVGTTYYYRVTAVDTAGLENEAFFSDTKMAVVSYGTIAIRTPATNHDTNASPIAITGACSFAIAGDSVVAYRNGVAQSTTTVSATGAWSCTTVLAAVGDSIEVRLSRLGVLHDTDRIHVSYYGAPTCSIVAPPNLHETSVTNITVTGTVAQAFPWDSVVVYVNGVGRDTVRVSDTMTWVASVPLAGNPESIVARLTNRFGNIAADTITVSKYTAATWYVNDSTTTSDSYTTSTGSDTLGTGSRTQPFASITRAIQSAKAGDTIYIDAGTFNETVVVDTNTLRLIGVDSSLSIINPPGDSVTSGRYAIFADTHSGLEIRDLRVTDALRGLHLQACSGALVTRIRATDCGEFGIYAFNGSDTTQITNCQVERNQVHGIYVAGSVNVTIADNRVVDGAGNGIMLFQNADRNLVTRNVVARNRAYGIKVSAGSDNRVEYNTLNANFYAALSVVGASSRDTFQKNFITLPSGSAYDTAGAENAAGVNVNFFRNWWGTTDTLAIERSITGASESMTLYAPFRLGALDTTLASDTVAPRAPDSVTANGVTETTVRIDWTAVVANEEASPFAVGLTGYRIYRSATADTSVWILRGEVGNATTSFTDSGFLVNDTRYYRVTAYDANTPVNESFFSDSTATGLTRRVPNPWYLNNNALAGDIFTTAVGNDANDGYAPSSPKLTWDALESLLSPGDSVYIDVGTFTPSDTFTILQDSITIIGVDSTTAGTIIDFNDTTAAAARAIFAQGRNTLTFQNFRVRRGLYGLWMKNSDTITITSVFTESHGIAGIFFDTSSPGPRFSTVSNVYASGNAIGFLIHGSDSNTFTGNTASSNTSYGWDIAAGDQNTFRENAANQNRNSGFRIIGNADGNTFLGNRSSTNAGAGFQNQSSDRNRFSGNSATNNATNGFRFTTSTNVYLDTNTVDSCGQWAYVVNAGCSLDTFYKNSFDSSPSWPDSVLFYDIAVPLDVARNYWGTTDEVEIRSKFGGAGADSIDFRPYRLTPPDTTPNSDIVAPKAPDTVAAVGLGETTIRVTWSPSTVNEEPPHPPVVDLSGYRVYRAITSDTTYWQYLGFKPAGTDVWDDSPVDRAYYYRVTAVDTKVPIYNESYYSDSIAYSNRALIPNVWYVNNASTVGDVYTTVVGSDANDGRSPSTPKLTIAAVAALWSQGDTIYLDAGTFTELVVIDTDYISLIGKDSITSIIDPPGLATTPGLWAITADTLVGLTIRNLGMTGAYDGIHFRNADSSLVMGCSVSSVGGTPYALDNGSDFNTFLDNIAVAGNASGFGIRDSRRNIFRRNFITKMRVGWAFTVDVGSDSNIVENNICVNNSQRGICLTNSAGNIVQGNEIDSSGVYQVYIEGTSNSSIVRKDNLNSSPYFPDSGLFNSTASAVDAIRNWWGTTDSSAIKQKIWGSGRGLVSYTPYRLGPVDTALSADTVAPRAPDTVAAVGLTETTVRVSWSTVSASEEAEAALGLNAYRIYRSATADTNNWTHLGQVAAGTVAFTDSNLSISTTRYYRVTAMDAASYVNESYYSDSIAGATPIASANVWYVNDASSVGDSFTSAVGSDANDGRSPSTPKLTINAVKALWSQGDTVLIDKGLYAETVVIDTDYISLIGKDSWSTVIDPPGAAGTIGLYAIFVDTQVGLTVAQIGLTGAFDGIHAINIDASTFRDLRCTGLGASSYVIQFGSDNNLIYHCMSEDNSSAGYYLAGASNNVLRNNIVRRNQSYGILMIGGSNGNVLENNVSSSNFLSGFYVSNSNNNLMRENTSESNAEYQFYFTGTSGADTAVKNNIRTAPLWSDSGAYNGTANGVDMTKNYWFSTDSSAIQNKIWGPGRNLVTYSPFRLGQTDTAPNADSVAPRAPDTVAATALSGSVIRISWSTVSASEEPEAALGLTGYKVYRATTATSATWTQIASLGTGSKTYEDAGLGAGVTRFYRVTAFDAAPYVNESFYSDSTPSATTGSNGLWYVNDTSTANDSFTSAVGADGNNGLTPATPFLHIDSALALAATGDTIFVDAGIYYTTETITIRDNGISIVGKDSSATGTLIDFLDSSATLTRCVYAHSKSDLYLRDFRVINGTYGVWFRNIDSSVIQRVQADSNLNAGIQLDTGSPGSYNNRIENSAASGNAVGFKLHASGSNTLVGNTASNNTEAGFLLDTASGNTLTSNTATGNGDGFVLRSSSDANLLESNTASGNENAGVVLLDADSNVLASNEIAGNDGYALVVEGSSAGSEFDSNTIRGSSENPDSAVYIGTTAEVDLSSTDFGTSDEATIRRKVAGPGRANTATEGFTPGMDPEPEPQAEIISPRFDATVLRTGAVEIVARPLANAGNVAGLCFQYRVGEAWIEMPACDDAHVPLKNGEARILWDARNMPTGEIEFRAVPVAAPPAGARAAAASEPNALNAAFHALRFTTDVEAADYANDVSVEADTVAKRQRVESGRREVVSAATPSGAVVRVTLETGVVPVRPDTAPARLVIGLGPTATVETASMPATSLIATPVAQVAFADGSQPTGIVTITLPLPTRNTQGEIQVNGRWVPAGKLEAWAHNTATGRWEKLDAPVIDLVAGTATLRTAHFSFFTLVAPVAVPTNLTGMVVYPNPFKPNDGDVTTGVEFLPGVANTGITFENTPTGSTVRIYTALGELVADGITDASGGMQWDVKNMRGEKVASGVYIYMVTSRAGERRTGKLVIVR
jgi:parallel beta-helix repeat protein